LWFKMFQFAGERVVELHAFYSIVFSAFDLLPAVNM
jgi:hypothetical protein